MSDDWAAVAAVVNSRMGQLRMSQLDLASRSGVSAATIREIQRNYRPRQRYGRTLAALSEALDWPSGYLDAVLAGQDPEEEAPRTETAGDDEVLVELRAIRTELQGIKNRLDALEADNTRLTGGQ